MNEIDSGTATPPPRTSAVLHELAYAASAERISAGEIVAGLRHRALGFTLLLFSLPCCLPMPPGVPTLCGIMVALIALHLIAAREMLWLPDRVARRTIERASLQKMADKAVPILMRLERWSGPRMMFVTGALFKRLTGLIVLLMGLILILPIPILGNLPPGLATSVIALGLSERDGIVILIGWGLALVATVITSTMGLAAVRGFQTLF